MAAGNVNGCGQIARERKREKGEGGFSLFLSYTLTSLVLLYSDLVALETPRDYLKKNNKFAY